MYRVENGNKSSMKQSSLLADIAVQNEQTGISLSIETIHQRNYVQNQP